MPLTLMYITNRPEVAQIAQNVGVDRIWIDLEVMGKEQRQIGMNSVKSHHKVEDIALIKPLLKKSKLLVRVNPIHSNSKEEINCVIENGAEIVMLPMFKTKREVDQFIEYVDGRAKVLLLLETAEANENVEDILSVQGIDEVHIGLNDLHLAYKKKFMFELLIDGTVDRLCMILKERCIFYGFGGLARIGYGTLPAEYILTEHYALGSQMVILSRSFCDANIVENPYEVAATFEKGIRNIRKKETEVALYTPKQFESNRQIVKKKIDMIIGNMQE